MNPRHILPLAVATLFLAGSAAASASTGSLAYTRDGDVFLAAPDGSRAAQLTTGGGYAWPSQADDGTVVAVRQTQEGGRTPRRLHRMNRAGTLLNAPTATVPVDNSLYIGPLAPKLSPDGRFVAYHYFYTGLITDSTEPRIALAHSDRDTLNGELTATLGNYLTPSWLQDGRLLAFYAKERTLQVDIRNPDDSVTNWFADPAVAPLLTDGEVTRAGDRLAAIGSASDLRLYDVAGGPPAEPQLRCVIDGLNAPHDPTWSPDGRALAWEEADGIHVAQLDDLGACASAARPLVVPGGRSPDWGVTEMNTISVVARSARLGTVARRGLAVQVRCSTACSVSAALAVDAKLARRAGLRATRIGSGAATGAAGRTVTLRVRLTKTAARRLRRLRLLDTTLTVTAGSASATRKLRLSV